MRARLWVLIGAGLAAAALPLAAHHAFSAEFDEKKPVKLTGRVTKMEWINPHAWIHMDVKGPDGKTQSWMIETGAPNTLIRRGWTKNSVPEGIEITVDGFQAKDGALRANGRYLVLPDGKQLFAGSSNTGAPGGDPPEK
jgi:hypothetical protein